MRKLISVLVALSLMVSCCMVAGATETSTLESGSTVATENVNISFKVGDSTLSINGENVTVEKPVVIGTGTTMVSLRFISEEFGATVGYDDATKAITVTKEVKSVMVHGSDSTYVKRLWC